MASVRVFDRATPCVARSQDLQHQVEDLSEAARTLRSARATGLSRGVPARAVAGLQSSPRRLLRGVFRRLVGCVGLCQRSEGETGDRRDVKYEFHELHDSPPGSKNQTTSHRSRPSQGMLTPALNPGKCTVRDHRSWRCSLSGFPCGSRSSAVRQRRGRPCAGTPRGSPPDRTAETVDGGIDAVDLVLHRQVDEIEIRQPAIRQRFAERIGAERGLEASGPRIDTRGSGAARGSKQCAERREFTAGQHGGMIRFRAGTWEFQRRPPVGRILGSRSPCTVRTSSWCDGSEGPASAHGFHFGATLQSRSRTILRSPPTGRFACARLLLASSSTQSVAECALRSTAGHARRDGGIPCGSRCPVCSARAERTRNPDSRRDSTPHQGCEGCVVSDGYIWSHADLHASSA